MVVLRNGVELEDPLGVLLGFLDAHWSIDAGDPSRSASFGEADLRLANRGGARISGTEIGDILRRREPIEKALHAIAPDASLARGARSVPWSVLRELFDAFGDIRGVGVAKMTKALHPKWPALVPMLDSVVQSYLVDDDPGPRSPFGARALELVRSYKRDLDKNRSPVRALRQELAKRSYVVTEVRILDLLIWSVKRPA
jgi:Family of unknown function (DUF6308)